MLRNGSTALNFMEQKARKQNKKYVYNGIVQLYGEELFIKKIRDKIKKKQNWTSLEVKGYQRR